MVSLVTKHNEYDDIIFQVIKLKVSSLIYTIRTEILRDEAKDIEDFCGKGLTEHIMNNMLFTIIRHIDFINK